MQIDGIWSQNFIDRVLYAGSNRKYDYWYIYVYNHLDVLISGLLLFWRTYSTLLIM